MEGMNQHLEFQVRIAGGNLGDGGGGSNGHGNQRIFQNVGETPDDIPDIGSMIPIDRS